MTKAGKIVASYVIGRIAAEVLVEGIVKPIKKKIKESRESKAMVIIDGVKYEGVVEGA